MKSNFLRSALALGLFATAAASQAVIDVTAITTAVSDASVAISTVGAAVLIAMVGLHVYKWIRRAL